MHLHFQWVEGQELKFPSVNLGSLPAALGMLLAAAGGKGSVAEQKNFMNIHTDVLGWSRGKSKLWPSPQSLCWRSSSLSRIPCPGGGFLLKPALNTWTQLAQVSSRLCIVCSGVGIGVTHTHQNESNLMLQGVNWSLERSGSNFPLLLTSLHNLGCVRVCVHTWGRRMEWREAISPGA